MTWYADACRPRPRRAVSPPLVLCCRCDARRSPRVDIVHAQVEVLRHQGWLLTERADLDSCWQAHRRVARTRAA
jgi:hypothetical protein